MPQWFSDQASAVNDASSPCVVGSSSSCPAQSPQEIFNLYGTTTNGTYWLNVNGTATQTYLILDTSYPDGGMWFLGMKGSKGSTTFKNDSTYWTSQTTTTGVTSLTNDVSSDAKFDAFNYLPITKVLAVFKDRDSYNFNTSGSGDLGTNSFGGHTWMETITSTTMYSRFTTTSALVDQVNYSGRYTLTRETNASNGKLVFPYQTGWTRYGFNNTTSYVYRWGMTYNNETNYSSNDSGSGIGMVDYSAAAQVSYSDNLTVGPNGSSGASSPGTFIYPSGFQIWGKMAEPTLAAPTTVTQSQISNTSTQISWNSVASATEYLVQYKTSAQNWSASNTVRVTNPNSTPSTIISGLANTTYNVRVWARGNSNTYGLAAGTLTTSLDLTGPSLSSAATNSAGTKVILTFSETLNSTTAATSAFTVTVNGSAATISSVAISGSTVELTLGSAITAAIPVTFTYTDPSASDDANAVQDSFGNDASSISSTSVTNNSTVPTSSTTSVALNPAATTVVYRSTQTIRATLNVSGKVNFQVNGKSVPGCKAVSTVTSGTITASCTWRPAVHRQVAVTATLTPTSASYSSSTSSPLYIWIVGRTGTR